jgi:hypothetical protein
LNHARNSSHYRLGLLLALLALFAVTLAAPQPARAATTSAWLPQPAPTAVLPDWLPQPTAMTTCVDAHRVDYYSDATYTTKVGQCIHGCCQLWTCTGTLTNYSIVATTYSCDFN